VKVTPDTNVLVRVIVADNAKQTKAAEAVLGKAETIALTLTALCELAWVLSRGYKANPKEIAESIRRLSDAKNVVVNRPAVEAGLELLESGGDFADGVIAYEGRWQGGETFLSFDRDAVRILAAKGRKTYVPA
jgi:predicted nucleic-acid-binding protein